MYTRIEIQLQNSPLAFVISSATIVAKKSLFKHARSSAAADPVKTEKLKNVLVHLDYLK